MPSPFDEKRLGDELVVSLRQAMSVSSTLALVPGLLKKILRRELWRERVIQTGETVRFDRFEEFVATKPLEGLGATIDIVRNMLRGDPEALSLFDEAVRREPGRPADGGRETGNNVTDSVGRPEGNTAAKALRRLRKDAPTLHERVVAGEMSPHAAMVEAGFRPKTVTVRATADGFAKAARRHLGKDWLEQLEAASNEQG